MGKPIESWLDRHPWRGRLAFLGFGAFLCLFVRSGLANQDLIDSFRGASHKASHTISMPGCVEVHPAPRLP